jgi:diguanylate cyclase (GGDEF)-like protein/PAS domain S-box-containing protein
MNRLLRVLIVEDFEIDVALLIQELQRGGYEPDFKWVNTPEAMDIALSKPIWDVVIANCFLPGFDVSNILALLKERKFDLPLIIVSDDVHEDQALAVMRAGAQDYLIKSELARLVPAIERELRVVRERQVQRQIVQALHENENRFRTLIEHVSDMVTILDASGIVKYKSPSVERILGYKPEELVGKNFLEYIHPEDVSRFSVVLGQEPGQSGRVTGLELRCRHRNGLWRFLEATLNHLLQDPTIKGVVLTLRDITDRKLDEETIRHLAYYDALTGLPNRTLFNDRLTQALAHAHRTQQELAVMSLHLDQFKTINDTLGYALGDRLLREITQRLTGCLGEGDTLAHLGNGEFLLLLPGIGQVQNLEKISQRILEAIEPPFNLDNHEFRITVNMGVSFYPSDGETAEVLIKNADAALHRAKLQGKNNYQLYTSTIHAKALERLVMESSLRRALERNELLLYYQPQLSLQTGQIVGAEALVRWQHPTRGLISPMKFVPLAEETGLIVPLGEWVLRSTCTQAKAWQKAGFRPIRVAVNLSARLFKQKNLVENIARILEETELDPRYLELELTESTVMENAEATLTKLQELKAMGIQLSIDDFGTGYSSLSYLRRFSLDTLKIDQSFVQDITTDPDGAVIARLIIDIAHSLKLRVIAEGVETEGQLTFLRAHHCDEIQGYFFSKPLSAGAFTRLLREGR